MSDAIFDKYKEVLRKISEISSDIDEIEYLTDIEIDNEIRKKRKTFQLRHNHNYREEAMNTKYKKTKELLSLQLKIFEVLDD